MNDIPSADAIFSPLVERAIELAAKWHDVTYRKGTWREPVFDPPTDREVQVPVMTHLAAVASIVQRAGWGDETVAAAYLHDAIEDRNRHGQRLRRQQLREAVGSEVERLVAAVSEQKLDADDRPRPWRDRKEDYVSNVQAAPAAAKAISLADKLHNLWSINESLRAGEDMFTPGPNRPALSAGPDAQLWFHRAVLEATSAGDDPRLEPMRERLQQEIERFEEWVEDAASEGKRS